MKGRGIFLMLGAPGSGKGTQAKRLARAFNMTHLSTGDVLREEAKKGTPLGKKAVEVMAKGELVEDEVVAGIIRERIVEEGPGGVILDGFPRSLSQARLLDEFAGGAEIWVVNLDVAPEILLKRLSGRRYCMNCGRIYNFYFSPTREPGVCDRCGEELVHRRDDEEEVVKHRLEVYEEVTSPLLDLYSSRNRRYLKVNGDQDPDSVFAELSSRLESLGVTPCAQEG